MSKQSELLKNTLIIAVGRLSTQFLTFLLLPLYTAILSPESYGQLDIITIYISLAATTLTLQMEMSVFRYLIDARKADDTRRSEIISSAIAVALSGAVLGVIILFVIGITFSLGLMPYIMGAFATTIALSFMLQVARGLGRNDLFAIASIISGLTNIGLSVFALLVLRTSIDGLLIALTIANLVGLIFLILKTRMAQLVKISYVRKLVVKELIGYSWPLVPNHIAIWGISGISRTIVAIVMGFVAMGIYAAASKFTLIYSSLHSIFAMSWTESVSLHLNKKDDVFLSNVTNSMVRIFGSIAIGIIGSVAVLFPYLVSDAFADARVYVPILILGGFLSSIVTHYGAIYLAAKETKTIAKVTIQAVFISTVLTLVGIWLIGLYAPALAIAVTYLYIAVRRHYDVQKFVKITYNVKKLLPLVIVAIFTVILYYINITVINYLVLVVLILALTVINKNEINQIKKMILKKGR